MHSNCGDQEFHMNMVKLIDQFGSAKNAANTLTN